MFIKIGVHFALIGALWFMITVWLGTKEDGKGNVIDRIQFWAYEQVDNPPWISTDEPTEVVAEEPEVEEPVEKKQGQLRTQSGLYSYWKW